jgi:uncharacterized protein (DUF427 family)
MRALFAGQTLLDSRRGVLLHQTRGFPTHYFPLNDLRPDLVIAHENVPGKPATWSAMVGDSVAERAVTASPRTASDEELLPGFVTIDYAAMDRWFEEDEPVYAHPRDPYHRVDVRASSRHVLVRHRDQVIAESRRPKLLFETSNPIRYYLPFDDVELGLLEISETVSECPYKGDGQHWHLHVDGEIIADAAWSLPHPLPEGLAAAEHVCFYPAKVELEVDGHRVED